MLLLNSIDKHIEKKEVHKTATNTNKEIKRYISA